MRTLISSLLKQKQNYKTKIMKQLIVSREAFTDMLLGIIKSGVSFESEEKDGLITINFTGGY